MLGKRVTLVFILISGIFCASFSPKFTPSFGIKTVVIDAGHGGKDPGCLGSKYMEKDITLAIALKLGAYIEKNIKDVKVVYTRKTDVFPSLDERAAIANKHNADLFICIHCNASENKTVYGSESYIMGLHKTKANLDVAKRENASILLEDNYKKKYNGFDPNSDEGYILMSMQQNAFLDQSLNIASKVQKQFKEKAGRVDKGVKQAGFLVLWKTSMPGLLIETGFLTEKKEEKFLGSEKGQDYIAASIFRAFRQYKNEVEGKYMKYDDEIENLPIYKPAKEDTLDEEIVQPKIDSVKKEEPKVEIKTPVVDSVKPKVEEPKIVVEEKTDVVFKVQFASSDKQIALASAQFKGVTEVGEYFENGRFKYTSGFFKTPDEAAKRQNELRKSGFADAFVVAFHDGKRIPVNEAMKLIKK